MTRDDVIDVLSVVAAATRRTVGEMDADIWQAIIGELPKDLALQAVRDHLRDQPSVWLEPGHVYQRARAIRRDELDRSAAPRQIESNRDEHFRGDVKAERDPAPYPRYWTADQRTVAYWYAVSLHAMPHSTAGWEAIAQQIERKRAEREQETPAWATKNT
jgi:hypothetical protein